jgi:hypothetical protein
MEDPSTGVVPHFIGKASRSVAYSSLPPLVEDLAPLGPRGDLSAVGVDGIPVVLTQASVQINLVNSQELGALPEEASDPENKDDRDRQDVLQDTLGTVGGATNRDGSVVALSSQDNDAKGEAHVRTVDTADGLEGDLIKTATLGLPGSAETNVALNRS